MQISNSINTCNSTQQVISVPFISNADFGRMMIYFDTYVTYYNNLVNELRKDGFKGFQTLKSTHRQLFQDLISQLKGRLAQNRVVFNDNPEMLEHKRDEPYILFTNNKKIKSRTLKNDATVYRNIQRLIDAGIIRRKLNHGTRADYELHIEPRFVFVSDAANNCQNSVISSSCENELLAKCNPIFNNKNNINNNKIIHLETVENSENLLKSSDAGNSENKNIDKNRRKQSDFVDNSIKVENSEHHSLPKNKIEQKQEQEQWFLANFAAWFVEYLLKTLFSNHSHYPAVVFKAKEYAKIYFKGCKRYKDFERRFEVLKTRVDMAKQYVELHNFNMSNIYITDYLDLNNTTSGFVKTKEWYLKSKEYERIKRNKKAAKRKKSDREKVIDIVNKLDKLYLSNKLTVRDFIIAEDYVIRNVPNLHAYFMTLTEYMRYGRYKKQTA